MSAGAILTQGLGSFGSPAIVVLIGLQPNPQAVVVGCVQAMAIYQPGAVAAEVYQPGAQATQVGCQ